MQVSRSDPGRCRADPSAAPVLNCPRTWPFPDSVASSSPGERSLCSAEHLGIHDMKEQHRRRRMEAEANRFAALLLIPPPLLRAELKTIRRPRVDDVVRLAKLFDV